MTKPLISKKEITKDKSSKNRQTVKGIIKSIKLNEVKNDKVKFNQLRVCIIDENGEAHYGNLNHEIYRDYFKNTCGLIDSKDVAGCEAIATLRARKYTKDGVEKEIVEIKYLELIGENGETIPVPYEQQVVRF